MEIRQELDDNMSKNKRFFLHIRQGYLKVYPGLEVIKLLPCSNHLSSKIKLLINIKMPTIVDILTSISMINTRGGGGE